jgi:hypothetical protein
MLGYGRLGDAELRLDVPGDLSGAALPGSEQLQDSSPNRISEYV